MEEKTTSSRILEVVVNDAVKGVDIGRIESESRFTTNVQSQNHDNSLSNLSSDAVTVQLCLYICMEIILLFQECVLAHSLESEKRK